VLVPGSNTPALGAIDNQDTLRKIEEYLVPSELAALFSDWLEDYI
jgi:hypothetical protein